MLTTHPDVKTSDVLFGLLEFYQLFAEGKVNTLIEFVFHNLVICRKGILAKCAFQMVF